MPRVVLALSIALMWANYAWTERWAAIVGSLHGPKEPLFVVALIAATIAVVWPWKRAGTTLSPLAGRLVMTAGVGLLAVSFFQWFPLHTWTQLPFLDNWPTRFQTTVDGLALYLKGVGVAWQWNFLGGYPSSSDISQTISTMAAIPMLVLGDRVGFHLTHLLVLLALPLLIYVDVGLDDEDRPHAAFVAGLVGVAVTGWFSYFLTRSGDTNSMNGLLCAVAALTGSHAAATNRRWGTPMLVGSMALLGYCHTAFLIFTAILLVVESAFYRDFRRLLRAIVAVATGVIAALPLTWESWRYPAYFTISNVEYPSPPFEVIPFLRDLYYNVEILFLPWRWFNDFSGLFRIMTPVLLFVAWTTRSRTGFYAWAGFTATGLMMLSSPTFGYAFMRPIHLIAVFPIAALAGFLLRARLPRHVLGALTVLVVVYLQVSWMPIPHIETRRELDPALVEHVRGLDGAMVLFENAFHRDMDGHKERVTERTPFPAHVEGILAAETGKRFYAGLWDGWQWSVFRDNLLAGGAFKGQLVTLWQPEEVEAELRRWGVRHLVVWSKPATEYFGGRPEYVARWTRDRWTSYEYLGADPREVVTPTGRGSLSELDRFGAKVNLEDARAGDLVVVRTHYYPAWTARHNDQPVTLFAEQGQLAFRAPADGSYVVALEYPRRYWLNMIAIVAIFVGLFVARRVR